jgi:phospholipase C
MTPVDPGDLARLRALKHIVVVMMENRSFDHMLGYLKRDQMADLDGLSGDEFNVDKDGKRRSVHAFDAEANLVQRPGEALQKRLDPDHSPKGVQVQLGRGYVDQGPANHGFVRNFIETRKAADNVGADLWNVPMGYYTSKDVPVYDYLARQFCVCDRWFASIPGDTWPNRLYATTGRQGPRVTANGFWKAITNLPPLKRLASMPLYDIPAFTRRLRDDQWRWYSHDPGTLRLVDGRYRDLANPHRDNFAFFDRRQVDWLTESLEGEIVAKSSFLDDAAKGTLRQVSWIDPNFVDLSVLETASNDDHPPSDIRAGQAFIFDVYDALSRSPVWDDTLLIVVYDEHGGFYDHVTPPPLPDADEARPNFKSYGVRVPALLAGPRVKRMVLHAPSAPPVPRAQHDHASIIKTILLAFADQPEAAVAQMPGRVQRAPHLAEVLGDAPRTDIDDPRNIRQLMSTWRIGAREQRMAAPAVAASTESPAADGAGQPVVLTDFQTDWQNFALMLRHGGLVP